MGENRKRETKTGTATFFPSAGENLDTFPKKGRCPYFPLGGRPSATQYTRAYSTLQQIAGEKCGLELPLFADEMNDQGSASGPVVKIYEYNLLPGSEHQRFVLKWDR